MRAPTSRDRRRPQKEEKHPHALTTGALKQGKPNQSLIVLLVHSNRVPAEPAGRQQARCINVSEVVGTKRTPGLSQLILHAAQPERGGCGDVVQVRRGEGASYQIEDNFLAIVGNRDRRPLLE